jgi:hypothetical protein
MSDFLTNLAARSSGTGAVIQPRLPSRFEPSPLSVPSLVKRGPVEVTQENAEESPEPKPRPIRPKAHEARLATPQSRPDAAEEEQSDRIISPLKTEQQKVVPESSIATSPIPQVASMFVTSAKPLQSEPVRFTEEPSIEGPARPLRPTPETGSEKHPHFETAREQVPSRAEPPSISQEEIARLVRSMTAPRTESRRVRGNDRWPVSTPSAQTSIQVTIGRVEIRAADRQTRQQEQPAASPVMSLDEYLKQRRTSG